MRGHGLASLKEEEVRVRLRLAVEGTNLEVWENAELHKLFVLKVTLACFERLPGEINETIKLANCRGQPVISLEYDDYENKLRNWQDLVPVPPLELAGQGRSFSPDCAGGG